MGSSRIRTYGQSAVSNTAEKIVATRTGENPMYLPDSFAETDLSRLHDFIEQYSFGLLLSQVDGDSFGSHLPFLLDRNGGVRGTLIGHVAKANPQWRQAAGQTVLADFTGPHVYVSPSWYESEHVVPTWNYAAVHAYGHAKVIEDEDSLHAIVAEMVQVYERSMPQPWTFDANSTFMKRLLSQIVGLRIEIDRIEGKFKMNQNHPVERREKVVRALRQRGDENALAVADLIQATLNGTHAADET